MVVPNKKVSIKHSAAGALIAAIFFNLGLSLIHILILSIKPLLPQILKALSKAFVHLVFEVVPFQCHLKKAVSVSYTHLKPF